ncbi:MAG: fimbrillin family protein [Muribaculaceae bacterium]|nr:fimbrillin family protein [Muribaculaceae bacterium]
MAKYIYASYALLGIVLAASSCSHEDVGRVGNGESEGRIEFKASLPEVSSRATELKDATLDEIEVSAFTPGESGETTYFANKIFGRNNNTGKFVCYDAACIWPNNNDLLRFAAFAPSCDDMIASGGDAISTGDKLTGFKVSQNVATQFDFVTAIASGRLLDNEETGITLRFQHQLSRIQIKAWGNSASYNLEIAGVRLGGIGTGGTFDFTAQAEATDPSQAGVWESVTKGYMEYIFHEGDAIVNLDKTDGSPLSADKAVSIMGSKVGGTEGYDNSAMIVPSINTSWSYKDNAANGDNHADGMYFSVLVRVTDTTPYDTNGSIVYPYSGAEYAEEIIYLAIDKNDGKTVKARLYKQGDNYFTDAGHTAAYDLEANDSEVKAFGWAALPAADELKAGQVYTYTLNYSNGVGLRDPHDSHPGEPIISDKVLVNVEVADWIDGKNTDVSVPRR